MTVHGDVEMELRGLQGKAVIEGKTSVPFRSFVQLVLQRKVTTLFKERGDDPIIVSSELLTHLASAPQDAPENRERLVIVTLGVGVLTGIFLLAIAQVTLGALGSPLSIQELLLIALLLLFLAAMAFVLEKVKRRRNRSEKLAEAMEHLTGLLTK